MGRRSALDRFGRLEEELLREKAAVLARIAGTLEALITRLSLLREELERLPWPERGQGLEAYDELRARARRHRWYLEVQREALGLRHHAALDELYRIPEAAAR